MLGLAGRQKDPPNIVENILYVEISTLERPPNIVENAPTVLKFQNWLPKISALFGDG